MAGAGDVNGDGHGDVIIGASNYDSDQDNEGRAFVFHGSPAGLAETADWAVEGDQPDAGLGWAASGAGDVNGDGYDDVIVGADAYDDGESNEGAAFLYLGSPMGLPGGPLAGPADAAWSATGDLINARFGGSVSGAGDVNGDGHADVLIGAPGYDAITIGGGAAFLFTGSSAGLSSSPAWSLVSNTGMRLGDSVSSAGDVNGDGYADIVVGGSLYSNGQVNEGLALLFLGAEYGLVGGPTPNLTDAAWAVEGESDSARLGYSVDGAGDVNGDGYADVLIGAFHNDRDELDAGQAFLYLGSAAGLATSPDWTSAGIQGQGLYGFSVAGAGDVNGDGYADVIIGEPYHNGGEEDEGRALVYHGNAGAGLSLRPRQRRADDLAPLSPGLRASGRDFRLAAVGRTPFGRGRVKMEWEIKPLGVLFDGLETEQSEDRLDTGVLGASLSELTSEQAPGGHHWRLRLLYDPVVSPLARAGRWLTVPWNGWNETDLVVGAHIGGLVWEDRDGNGLMDPDEPRLGGIAIDLLDAAGTPVQGTVTAADGSYVLIAPHFEPVKIRVLMPSGYRGTTQDQGLDDTIDSDIHPITSESLLFGPVFSPEDAHLWSAGLRRVGPCYTPDEPLWLEGVRLVDTTTFLDIQDPNQPEAVSGYNIYRSSDAGLEPELWPMLASDVVDSDGGTPNIQYPDDTGDIAPSGVWFYQVTAYNHGCDTEGPW